MPEELVHFDIDNSVTPSKNAYYNVPVAYGERARARLKEMQAQGIIEEVERAPRWISGMSLVPKGKTDFRLVVNMRGPNKAIKRASHHLPTIDDMRVKLLGAAIFSKLDIQSFIIDGVIVFIDDILIYAQDQELLTERTKKVLKALKRNNLTLNKEKCEYNRTTIKFLGHQLSARGFAIDEDKVSDVKKNSKNLKTQQTFAASSFLPRTSVNTFRPSRTWWVRCGTR